MFSLWNNFELFVCNFSCECVLKKKKKKENTKWEWRRSNCCILYVCIFSSSCTLRSLSFLFFYYSERWAVVHLWCNLKPGWSGGGQTGRERGALAVYVKVLHCLMLNKLLYILFQRSVYVCVMGGGGGRRVGSTCTVKRDGTYHTHWVHRWINVQVGPWMKRIHNNYDMMIRDHGHGCEIVLFPFFFSFVGCMKLTCSFCSFVVFSSLKVPDE